MRWHWHVTAKQAFITASDLLAQTYLLELFAWLQVRLGPTCCKPCRTMCLKKLRVGAEMFSEVSPNGRRYRSSNLVTPSKASFSQIILTSAMPISCRITREISCKTSEGQGWRLLQQETSVSKNCKTKCQQERHVFRNCLEEGDNSFRGSCTSKRARTFSWTIMILESSRSMSSSVVSRIPFLASRSGSSQTWSQMTIMHLNLQAKEILRFSSRRNSARIAGNQRSHTVLQTRDQTKTSIRLHTTIKKR